MAIRSSATPMIAALACAACVATRPPPPDRSAIAGTPPSVQEGPGAPPATAPGSVWVAGYWHWTGFEYAWVPGHWEAPPPRAPWMSQG